MGESTQNFEIYFHEMTKLVTVQDVLTRYAEAINLKMPLKVCGLVIHRKPG